MGLLNDLLWLVFPNICVACSRSLNEGEKCICTYCRTHLPKTDFHEDRENPIAKQFWGKVPLEAATAAYHFTKGEKVRANMKSSKPFKRSSIYFSTSLITLA